MSMINIREGASEHKTFIGYPAVGTAFRGSINNGPTSTFISTTLGIVGLNPRTNPFNVNQLSNFALVYKANEDAVRIENYHEVDLEIIVKPMK